MDDSFDPNFNPHNPLNRFDRYSELPYDNRIQVFREAYHTDPTPKTAKQLSSVNLESHHMLAEVQRTDEERVSKEVAYDRHAIAFLRTYSDRKLGRALRKIDPPKKARQRLDTLHLPESSAFRPLIHMATFFHPRKFNILKGEEHELSEERYSQMKLHDYLHQDVFLEMVAVLMQDGHRLERLWIQRSNDDHNEGDQYYDKTFFVSPLFWDAMGTSEDLGEFFFDGFLPSFPQEKLKDGSLSAPSVPPAFKSLHQLTLLQTQASWGRDTIPPEVQQKYQAYKAIETILPHCHSLKFLTLGLFASSTLPSSIDCLARHLTTLDLSSLPVRASSSETTSSFNIIPFLYLLESLTIRPYHLSDFVQSQNRHSAKTQSRHRAATPPRRQPLKFLTLKSLTQDFNSRPSSVQLEQFQSALDSLVPPNFTPADDSTSKLLSTLSGVLTGVQPILSLMCDSGPRGSWWSTTHLYFNCVHEWAKLRHRQMVAVHAGAFEERRKYKFRMYAYRSWWQRDPSLLRENGRDFGRLAVWYRRDGGQKTEKSFDDYLVKHGTSEGKLYPWKDAIYSHPELE